MASSRERHPTCHSFDESIRNAEGQEWQRRAKSGLMLVHAGAESMQVGNIRPLLAPTLPKRLQQPGQENEPFNQDDSQTHRTPSTNKRTYDITELVKHFEDLMSDFRQDPQEHQSLSNVIGPNPWNLGFIHTGPLQKKAIWLLKVFSRSVSVKFPSAYSLEEAMRAAAHRGKLRNGKLCLEDAGQWTQICLVHVAAFCRHENLDADVKLILGERGNINARAMFDVALTYTNREELTYVSCSVQPIHFAVHAGNLHGVKVLLKLRAAVESRATFDAVPDYTPLHLATALWARAGEDAVAQHQVVKVLLDHSGDPHSMDLGLACADDLRPSRHGGSASSKPFRNGLKRGMVVTLDMTKVKAPGFRLRPDARQFLEQETKAHRSEFVLLADVEDEDDLVHLQMLSQESYLDEPKSFRIQQSCVMVQGWKFFDLCYCEVLDLLQGAVTPKTAIGSPGLSRAHTIGEESIVEDDEIQELIQARPQHHHQDSMRRRAVTVDMMAGGDAMQEQEDDPMDWEILPDIAIDDAVHLKLRNPLRPGNFYRKRSLVISGYLLHFVLDELIRESDRGPLQNDGALRHIVKQKADIHARAEVKRNTASDVYFVTAMHMAAVSYSLPAVKLLLDLKASIESAATFDKIPAWTPLADAIIATVDWSQRSVKKARLACTKDCVIQYLLSERANPDGCGGSGGLSCLHLAVGKNCESDIVCMLVENNADVTLKTSQYVRATRAHGNRGWDRGLTPLQICDYADQVYSQKARSEVMALLAPSLRGASFLLQDVTSMAAFSVNAADELVKRVMEEAKKDSEGSAARALRTLRMRAITGNKSLGLTAVDSIAELIEIAPSTAISLLDGLLLTEPDTEDPHVHPLPHRANMNYKHRAQGFGWSATVFDLPNLSVQTTYQPDSNRDRQNTYHDEHQCCHDGSETSHPEWPCWLRQQKLWHGKLAPKASCTRASLMGPAGLQRVVDQMGAQTAVKLLHQEGDRDVCIKVLLVANVLDVRIMMALTSVGWSDIFAEKVVQAILSAGYEQFCFKPITGALLQEILLFAAFLSWSFGIWFWQPKKTAWTVICAIFINESLTMAWWLRSHFSYGWTLKQFFLHPMAGFRLFQLYLLWWLLWRTFFGYDLDHTWRRDEDNSGKRTFERSLLGANLLLQCFLFIFLAKGASPRLEFGRHLLAILHSFMRLGVIFTVLILVFASFTSAYLVMGSKLPLRALIEKVYRGLFLADGEGLDVMEGGQGEGELEPNNLDTYLTLFSTFIVTICLLNVSIAVFTMEYEAAIKESWLHFWRWRARLCTEVLLCPRWPWKFESNSAVCQERRYLAQLLEWAVLTLKGDVLPAVYNSSFFKRTLNICGYRVSWEPLNEVTQREPIDEDAEYVKYAGWMTVTLLSLLGTLFLVLPFVHAFFSGLVLGLALTTLKSLCARGPYGLATESEEISDCEDEQEEACHGTDRPHFLWICYRSDYDSNVFMNKEVHREHLELLESRVNSMSQTVEKWGTEVNSLSDTMTKLTETVQRLEAKLPGMGVGGIAAMPSVPSMDGLIRASSVPFPDGRRNTVGTINPQLNLRRMGSVSSQREQRG
ncbi:unnamed protein product [Effrenium voratum]|uniref:Uncharacterized protein n=1 Tax=Effrenium voratum TaxID=2562239 RepID=A0AA36MRT3_9DINO|nr:unnamed protein product [Effrenium voratum]CAJ1422804.1 unnamed protein product [Effrenium voratum]